MAKKYLKSNQVMTRNVIMINGSCYVCIPMGFVRRYGIQPGDKMAIVAGEVLKMMPMKEDSGEIH